MMLPVLKAQAIIGMSIMPDKYRRLVDLDRKVCQIGCSAIEWKDLFAELDASGMPDWEKENVFEYKINRMLADYKSFSTPSKEESDSWFTKNIIEPFEEEIQKTLEKEIR